MCVSARDRVNGEIMVFRPGNFRAKYRNRGETGDRPREIARGGGVDSSGFLVDAFFVCHIREVGSVGAENASRAFSEYG